MAKFLNTSGTTYHLEELIKNAQDRLILISPYLKLNDRVKELLEDKNRLKIDMRIVYGKNELQPEEINWLKELTFVRTSFCKNLHAKCYLNESECIIASLNLYEFSQVNNNEMGVLFTRDDDTDLFQDAYEEAQRIIRISDEVRMSLEKVSDDAKTSNNNAAKKKYEKLTSSKIAKKLDMGSAQKFHEQLENIGWLAVDGDDYKLTELGKEMGGEQKSGKYGDFFLWPEDLSLS